GAAEHIRLRGSDGSTRSRWREIIHRCGRRCLLVQALADGCAVRIPSCAACARMAPRWLDRPRALRPHPTRSPGLPADDHAELPISHRSMGCRWTETADRLDVMEESRRARAVRCRLPGFRDRAVSPRRRRRRPGALPDRLACRALLARVARVRRRVTGACRADGARAAGRGLERCCLHRGVPGFFPLAGRHVLSPQPAWNLSPYCGAGAGAAEALAGFRTTSTEHFA